MQNYKTYIILIDGMIMLFNHKPEKRDFRKDARIFEVNPETQIDYLPDWFGRCFDHSKFKEITKTWK